MLSGSRIGYALSWTRLELEALRDFPAEKAFHYRGRWRARFVSTLVDMQVRCGFLDEIAIQLRNSARRLRLDDDEYLEFLVSAVQSIPYVAPDSGVRTPVEVVYEGEGICTEKSVLLASLMVHEGYDTVMWSFRSQHHVAVGVATSGPSYRDTGYAFIETTSRAFIGQVDPVYRGAGPVYSPPEQIEFGGVKRYEASLRGHVHSERAGCCAATQSQFLGVCDVCRERRVETSRVRDSGHRTHRCQ